MSHANAFAPVRPDLDFPADEARVLAFWKEHKIFEKTLTAETRRTGPSKGVFVFYEGPPTANGMPHNGHVLTRAVKDAFPRYATMRGYDVPRKAGWDTHGLPVETEVEKDLRIHGKADIVKYGVEPFIDKCIASVFQYTDAWEKLTDKIGFWVDLEQAYVTYHQRYVESVWWALSILFDKGLLYRGEKVVWWWAQGGTALSAAEVGNAYKTVDDPSAYVSFPLAAEGKAADGALQGAALCVWTTTPWTLPSNMYAAVRADFDYVVVRAGDRKLVVAAGLREDLEKRLKTELLVEATLKGADLAGLRYSPPFDLFHDDARGSEDLVWRVITADFVTLDAGTGIVHVAPAFGEDDHRAHQQLARALRAENAERTLPLFCAVSADGTFVERFAPYAGKWVKSCDKDLLHDLSGRGRLVHQEVYRHEYPFCWRASNDPLIQLARPAWYIRTTDKIQDAIANNRKVQWLPDHIQEGRFGDFLANNVDWALSRERFWGTPLNIWVNDVTGRMEAPASVAEIRAKNPAAFAHFEKARAENPNLSEHLIVHKPWIDQVTWQNAGEPGTYRRVPEVIDCWFDSGCMPFAQWGYPHADGSKTAFERAFPADFISEAIDQTRGWFYSLLMISTLVFDDATQGKMGLSFTRSYPHPYKTCVVLGHICDKEGKKESKSSGNYTPPDIILDRIRLEMAVVTSDDPDAQKVLVSDKAAPSPGVAFIARDDYEGLDFSGDSAKVLVYPRERGQGPERPLELRPLKRLGRRVLILHPEDAAALGVHRCGKGLEIRPNAVGKLPVEERVWVEDPSSKAPGADAFRWFFYASSPSWSNTRHSLTNVRTQQKDFLVKLRNVLSFFTIYANIDGFSPAKDNASAEDTSPEALAKSAGYRPAKDRALLDRWILSELALTTRGVTKAMDGYLLYDAAQRLIDFVESMSNWYVRRSRARFWAGADGGNGNAQGASRAARITRPSENRSGEYSAYLSTGSAARARQPGAQQHTEHCQDKHDAYFTLYECLTTTARLLAPFCPFFAEEMYQNLVRTPWPDGGHAESVHLTAWPEVNEQAIDEKLSSEMRAIRELVSLGLQVRTAHKLKVRQPLGTADLVVASEDLAGAVRNHEALVREELNVHEVRLLKPGQEGAEVKYVLKPNFRALGPKLGKKVQVAKQVLAKVNASAFRAELATAGSVTIDIDGERVALGPEEIEVTVEASEGFAAAGGRAGVVVLHTALTEALKDEGLGREVLSRIQGVRKELALSFTARIRLAVDGSDRVKRVVEAARAEIEQEALCTEIAIGAAPFDGERRELTVDGEALILTVKAA